MSANERSWPGDRGPREAPSIPQTVAAGLRSAEAACADLARRGCQVRSVRVDQRGAAVTIAPPPAYARMGLGAETSVRDQDGTLFTAHTRDAVLIQWTEPMGYADGYRRGVVERAERRFRGAA